MMKKTICTRFVMLAMLVIVLLLSSCRGAVEKAREKIRIEEIEKIETHALAGVDIALRVKNDTRHKLLLRNAALTVWYGGSRVGEVILREGVELPRRTIQSVVLRWHFKIEDPLALYGVVRRIQSGNLSDIGVSYEVLGRGGPMRVNISQPEIPLSEFLRTFGVRVEDLKKYLGK